MEGAEREIFNLKEISRENQGDPLLCLTSKYLLASKLAFIRGFSRCAALVRVELDASKADDLLRLNFVWSLLADLSG